jgi:hypothetical protein
VQVQAGPVGLAAQVALGQRRPLIGPLGLVAEQHQPTVEALDPQGLGRLGAGQPGTDDHKGPAARHQNSSSIGKVSLL